MFWLITVNLLFALGLVGLLMWPVENNWAWLGFITAWLLAETWLSRDPTIKWWHWAWVLIFLTVVDVAAIALVIYIKGENPWLYFGELLG